MLKLNAPNIYHHVESRDPAYNDNPPFIPFTWLNSVSGELFSCTQNDFNDNIWFGTSGSRIPPYNYYPSMSLDDSFTVVNDAQGVVVIGGNLIVSSFGYAQINYFNGISNSLDHNSTAPGTYPSALATDGTNLIIASPSVDTIYRMDGVSTTILDSINTPSTDCNGISWDGVNLISSDRSSKIIYKHDGFSETILDQFSVSGYNNVLDVSWCDGNLLASDKTTFYLYDGFSSSILNTYTPPDSLDGTGIFWMDHKLISTSDRLNTVYIHSIGTII